jgi:Lrp/AsnC family transcriptional regulator for asnA, asnC and gidA
LRKYENHSKISKTYENHNTVMDQTDLDIISYLQSNGRMPFTDIAKALDISEGTVRNRVSRLTETRILQIVGMVDPYQLGYDAPAVISISVQPPLLSQIANSISKFPEVSYLIMVSGEYDLLVEVLCKDRDHLANFLNEKLLKVPGIISTETSMVLHTYKMSYGALPEISIDLNEG